MFKPLENIRVVTLALNVPGPLVAKRLLDLGAAVIKIEPPQGDPLKQYCAKWYDDINAGQDCRAIDLKSIEGKKQLATILSSTDLLITAQRTKALDNLGLDWVSLHQSFPQLNHIAIVGYPFPDDNEAGHDLTYQAKLGLLKNNQLPSTLMADMAGAEMAAFESLALVIATQAGKRGQKKMIALSDAAEYMAQPLKYGVTADGGLLSGVLPEYSIYETKQGWIALAALESHFSARLKEQLGLETVCSESLTRIFKQKTAHEWVAWASERDIPLAEVKSV